jgi:outer membrane receptor for ferrienterochelin and colicin
VATSYYPRVARLITRICVTWLLLATAARAQTNNGSIKGFITDTTGALVPGVTVSATSVALMGTRTARSDRQGYYRLLDLPAGNYQLEARLAGFAPFERRDLVVQAGLTIQLDFTMRIGDLSETVAVRREAPLLETEKATRTIHLDGEFIRALPLGIADNWVDVLKVAPGIVLRDGDTELVETHGAGASNNVFLLDGIDVSESQVNTSLPAQLPPDSVAEVWITTSGHDATSRMGSGAQVGVVTRSGGNQIHGAAKVDLQFKRLNATNVAGGSSADRSITRPEVWLGGPIIRDRLWYFGAYRHNRERRGIARTETDLVILRLFDPSFVRYDSAPRHHESLVKATYQLTPADQASLAMQFDRLVTDAQVSPRFTRERAGRSRFGGLAYNVTWRRHIGARAAVDAKVGLYSKRYESALARGDGPNVRIYSNVMASLGRLSGSGPVIIEMGHARSDARQLQRRSDINATLTYFPGEWRGSHELTAGMHLSPWNNYSFEFNAPNNGFNVEERVLLDAANPAAGTRTFHRGYVTPVTVSGDRRSSRAASFFAQDSWRPGRSWVVNAGLRIEHAETFDTWGDAVQSSWQAGPRLGATYRPTIDGRTVIRGGFNRLFDAITNRMTPSQGSLRRGARDEYDLDGDGSLETVVTVPAVLTRPAVVLGSNRGFASPNLRQPRTDEISVGISHQLPFKITADATFIRRVYRDRIVTTDTNGIYEDGRFLGYRDPMFNEIFEIRNGDANWLVYRAIELSLQRSFSRNLQFLVGYSYGHQWIDGTWDQNDPASFLQPDAFPNRKGVGASVGYRSGQINSLATSQTNFDLLGSGVPPHTLKINGTSLLPLGLAAGVTYFFQMGQYSGAVLTLIPQGSVPHPRVVTLSNGRVVLNPLATNTRFFYPTRDQGQLQLPSINELNLRITKRLRRGGHTLEAGLEVFNLFNRATPRAFEAPIVTAGQPALFGLTYPQAPRAGMITARWAF